MQQRKHDLDVLSQAIILKLYKHAQREGGELFIGDLEKSFSIQITSTFITSASRRLDREFVKCDLTRYYEIRDAGIDYVQKQLSDPNSIIAKINRSGDQWLDDELTEPADSEADGLAFDTDVWASLQIERSRPEYNEAVSAVESALSKIAGSNEYAASEPDERDRIVWSISEGLKHLKNGMPNRTQVDAFLRQPMKCIADKFANASMGELAKEAVKAISAWLGTLI